MIKKFALDKSTKLVMSLAFLMLLIVIVLGLAVNGHDPISGIVTIFGSLARSFKSA